MKSISMDRNRWIIAAAVALVLALALYLGGRFQERGRSEGIRGELGSRITTLTDERDRIREELGAARDRNALLSARSLLFETALDLERRNFGTANARLDEAAARLGSVRDATGRPEIEALRAQIADMDLRVAADLGSQRETVLGLAARLDTIIGTTPREAATP